MKNTFWEYYHPTKKEIEDIKNQGIYIFDACSILKLYTLSKEDFSKIIKKMDSLSKKGKVWITHQNCLEYHRNRLGKVIERYNIFDQIFLNLDKLKKDTIKSLDSINRDLPSIVKIHKSKQELDKTFTSIEKNIKIYKNNLPDLRENDFIRNKIEKIFKNNIGDAYSEKELENKNELATERRRNNRRPGLLDDTNGDIISWYQMKEFIKNSNFQKFIYITEEKKADFWANKKTSKDVQPSPDLIKEIYEDCDNKMFYIASLEDILDEPVSVKKIDIYLQSETSSSVVGSDQNELITNNDLLN